MGNDAETTPPAASAAAEEQKPADAAPADAAPAVDAAATEGEQKKEGEGAEKKEGEGEGEGEGDGVAKKDADELQLYPLAVKGPAGEEIELQVNPADTVMDLKQFLADAPETCFYTAYDLILTKPDGLRYHLMDYVEIGEVADVAAGGCLLEMFNTFYDDRAVRLHVRKTRELISMAGSYSSASTAMAAEYELVKGLATERELGGDEKEEGEGKEGEGEKDGEKDGDEGGEWKKSGKGKKGKGRRSKEEEAKEKERREKEKERERKAKLPSSKARMEEIASLEQGVGLGDDPKGVLAKVMVKGGADEDAAPVCVESIAFSSFNPVPGPRRLQGDLVYLEVVTAEGKLFCVTAHTRGFFVNRSGSGRKLDPRPAEPKMDASTLIGLLRQISPLFSKAFAEVIERKANRHPFENMLAPLPPNDWAAKPIWGGADGTGPLQYTRDVARSEDALMAPFGIDFSGVLRDWNEELQSCRELPRNSLQDRILRDRALYRVSCEFADSAVRGAKAVIGRSIPPINPHDADRFHMYVHNNIFFSLAVDGDFAALQQIREAELKQQAEAEAAKKGEGEGGEKKEGGEEGKEEGKKEGEKEEEKKVETKEEKKEKRDKKKKEKKDKKEKEKKEQEAAAEEKKVEEAKAEEGDKKEGEKKEGEEGEKKEGEDAAAAAAAVTEAEQATYASSNNDLKGTMAVNNADIPGLYSLAMAIVDYRGHRVIAQSIIPGILYGDRTTQMLYGSVDTGKTIKWSDSFHPKVAELGKALHLKEHKVTDGDGKEATLCSPVETKGILGSDDRKYLLDLIRLTPRDANFTATTTSTTTAATGTDTNSTANAANAANAANRLAILRPELVEKFCREEQVERWMAQKGVSERPSAEEVEELREKAELPDVLFNPNVLTEFKLADDSKEVEEDEALVRKAGTYLIETALPALEVEEDEALVRKAGTYLIDTALPALEVEEDEALVRKAGKYLIETALPALVADIKSSEGWPVDGRSLASTMHAHGVNLRYLGRVSSFGRAVVGFGCICYVHVEHRQGAHRHHAPRPRRQPALPGPGEFPFPSLFGLRWAGGFLSSTWVRALVADTKSSEGGGGLWMGALASTMHAHGVNLRYLGRVAKEVADVEQVYWLCVAEMVVRATKHVLKAVLRETLEQDVAKEVADVEQVYWLCVAEMVVRATKHVLKAVLRETLEQDVAGAIAHFLNCFLGTSTTTPPPTLPGVGDTDKAEGGTAGGGGKKKKKGKGGERKDGEERKEEGEEKKEAFLFVVDVPGYTRITADMVWSDITEGVKYKYQFEIPPETRKMVRSLATLRNICLKMGIVLAARDYNLECDVPIAIADVYDLLPQMGIVLAARDYNLECDVPIAIADMGIVLAARDYNLECDVPIASADMGIVLAARDYNLECDVPIAIADVCDLLPQVKFAYTHSPLPVLPVLPFSLSCPSPCLALLPVLPFSLSCPSPCLALLPVLPFSLSCPSPCLALLPVLPFSLSCPSPCLALLPVLPFSLSCPSPCLALLPVFPQQMGIVLAARDYNLECDVPIAIADVCDLLPQVKFASPACSDAQKLLEKGKSLVHKPGAPVPCASGQSAYPCARAFPQPLRAGSGCGSIDSSSTPNSVVGLPLRPRFSATPQSGQWLREHETTLNSAFEILSEAYQILQQVCGPLHLDVAACCRYLALIFYHAGETGNAILQQHRELIINERVVGTDHPDTVHRHRCGGLQGDMQEGRGYKVEAHCLMQQHRELIINERVVGTDHPDTVHRGLQQHLELIINERVVGTDHPGTVHSYGNMALYFHSMGESELALRHFKRTLQLLSLSAGNDHPEVASLFVNIALTYQRTLQLLSLSAGNDHPEVASLFVNIALTYQDMGKLQNAMKYLQEAVRVSEKLLGENHVQVAVCHHALALAFSSMGAFKLALQEERKAQAVFEKAVGKEDPRTKESEQWVQSFLDRELRAQKQKVGQSAATVQQQQAAALRVAEALKQRPELLQVLQAAAAPGAGGSTSYQRAVADALLRGEVPPPAPGAGAGRFGGGMGATGSSGTGIRARGVDERASRAAAEARRKAAARGVNLRGAAGSAGARAGAPSAMDMEELINFINSTSPASGADSSSASKTGSAPAPAAGSAGGSAAPAGLGGVGLGVGVGAVSGAPPPTKAGGKKGAGAAAAASKPAATANGEASKGDAPLGLGGGLAPLPGGKGKGKAK
ncbi:unnamed protein product [Closterium sp. NIES-65]|nr:unnamed protein product [Closterium sp. NIES-65]